MTIGQLVGRDRPIAALNDACVMASRGQGGLLLVTGEPGIGKSALVGATAAAARESGALVLSGTCWDGDGAPGYWPWVQVIRDHAASIGPEAFERVAGEAGVGVDLLLGRAGSVPEDSAFEIYDTVTQVLVGAAREQSVLVLLEDLQWADAPSIRLLDFFHRHARLSRVLVIGTYRDIEVAEPDHPLHDDLDALTAAATVMPLTGLDRGAVSELLGAAGIAVDAEVVTELHRQTGGNPFFVDQTIQLWKAGGAAASVAPRVRDAVERRLARLGSEITDLLATAAILGAEFDTDVLLAAVDHPVGDAHRALDAAVGARLLVPCDGRGRYVFVHDLVREALIRGLPQQDARRRHADVVTALDRVPELRDRVQVTQAADHAFHAVPVIEASVAVGWLREAASAASARGSFDEAVLHLGRAIELVETTDMARWAELALEQATAQRRAGALDAARETLEAVDRLAQEHHDIELRAQSLFEVHSLGHGVDETGAAFADLLDDTYRQLERRPGTTSRSLAARLLAAGAQARMHLVGGEWDRAEADTERAVEIARTADDPDALAFCLLARHDAIWRPGTAAERASITDDMRRAAQATGNRELELQAGMLHMVALLERGDPRGLDEFDRYESHARETGLASVRYVAQTRSASMALLRGDHTEARRLMDESLAFGQRLGEVDADAVWNDQRWQLAVREGRLDEIEGLLVGLRSRQDTHGLVLEMSLATERQDVRRVQELLGPFEALGSRWPQWAALLWYTSLAEAAELVGDADLIEHVISLIEPYADNWAVLAGGVLVVGPMRLWLGRLFAAQGRWDDAIECFERAERSATGLRAQPLVLDARYHRARALLGRARPVDGAPAMALLEEVAEGASAMGMASLATRAGELVHLPVTSPSEFRLTDDVWTLTYGGHSVQAPNSKGLADIHTLLAHPGDAIPAAVLLDPAADAHVVATSYLGADELLDERARREYRRRIDQIDEHIDAALARHADHRAAELEQEREALLDELRRATGLGGRPRRLGAESERARKTVTARIRDTLKRLDDRHPALAAHLRDSISTGSSCAYRPIEPVPWTL